MWKYREICEKLQDIGDKEEEITQALLGLDEGLIDEEALQRLAPPVQETEQTSKRKKRIMEEKQRLGIDPREAAWDIDVEFCSNPTKLTTGRSQTRVTGNIDSFVAEGEFFYRTADTHGGKVQNGKRRNYYTTTGGKRVRKR